MSKVKPLLGGGFNDYLPNDMIVRRNIFLIIRLVFERFGFLPLETPGVEREEVLTGGDSNFNKLIFRVSSGSDQKLALRFDLTVPLARVVAAYPELPKPFKRYQEGKVWRGEKPQAGRYREFTQFDVDTVGSGSMLADAEIIAIMNSVMSDLGFKRFRIRVNNRKILNGLSEFAGFPAEKTVRVLRALDKLDRDGWDTVAEELAMAPLNEFDIDALGLDSAQIRLIKQFIDLKGEGQKDLLKELQSMMGGSPLAQEGISELLQLITFTRALGVPDSNWAVDLSVARGLGYYTGPVFETSLLDLPQIGSVFSGGRYDGLVANYSSQPVPATGASVGVDRLFAAMKQLNLLPEAICPTLVLVTVFDESSMEQSAKIATMLRKEGLRTDIYTGSGRGFKAQLTFALKKGIPLVVIAGPDELTRGVVQLKNLPMKRQDEVSLDKLAETVLHSAIAL